MKDDWRNHYILNTELSLNGNHISIKEVMVENEMQKWIWDKVGCKKY